jgi:hypothetical protein
MAENGRIALHNGIAIIANKYVQRGYIKKSRSVTGVWLVHSIEDFRYMWDREAMRTMGISWTRGEVSQLYKGELK